jgi:hypothetical protein
MCGLFPDRKEQTGFVAQAHTMLIWPNGRAGLSYGSCSGSTPDISTIRVEEGM